jgi:hypothetical protein
MDPEDKNKYFEDMKKSILSYGQLSSDPDKKAKTQLETAVISGNLDLVEKALQEGSYSDEEIQSAYRKSSFKGFVAITNFFYTRFETVRSLPNSYNLYVLSIREHILNEAKLGNFYNVKFFLENDQYIINESENFKDLLLFEILMISIKYNYVDLVKYMIYLGVDIHFDNEKALYLSIILKRFEISTFLIQNGADIEGRKGLKELAKTKGFDYLSVNVKKRSRKIEYSDVSYVSTGDTKYLKDDGPGFKNYRPRRPNLVYGIEPGLIKSQLWTDDDEFKKANLEAKEEGGTRALIQSSPTFKEALDNAEINRGSRKGRQLAIEYNKRVSYYPKSSGFIGGSITRKSTRKGTRKSSRSRKSESKDTRKHKNLKTFKSKRKSSTKSFTRSKSFKKLKK